MADQFDQKEYVRMKAALTRAINSKDHDRIIRVAGEHLERFETTGFPDDWSRWERARDDAMSAKMHARPSRGFW